LENVQHHQSVQSYVPPLIADWIRDQARLKQVSISIVVRDLLVAAWTRENDAPLRPTGTDPERQRVFATVALDALLAHHPDATLRERTVAAYHRRLERLGLIRASVKGGEDEA
jgi:hypothetical protein